jgi:hypothetical protein
MISIHTRIDPSSLKIGGGREHRLSPGARARPAAGVAGARVSLRLGECGAQCGRRGGGGGRGTAATRRPHTALVRALVRAVEGAAFRRRGARTRREGSRRAAAADMKEDPPAAKAHGLWVVSLVAYDGRSLLVRPREAALRDCVHHCAVCPPADQAAGAAVRSCDLRDIQVMISCRVVSEHIPAPARDVGATAERHTPYGTSTIRPAPSQQQHRMW